MQEAEVGKGKVPEPFDVRMEEAEEAGTGTLVPEPPKHTKHAKQAKQAKRGRSPAPSLDTSQSCRCMHACAYIVLICTVKYRQSTPTHVTPLHFTFQTFGLSACAMQGR